VSHESPRHIARPRKPEEAITKEEKCPLDKKIDRRRLRVKVVEGAVI
jgi:hypothetical protein